MNASINAKRMLAYVFNELGVNSWRLRQHGLNGIAILMYHRILPREELGPSIQPGMVVQPDILDQHIKYLRNHFEVISLADLVSDRSRDAKHLRKRPSCVLTFDDGWR